MGHKLFGLGARLNTAAGPGQGVNFSGLENTQPNMRYGQGTSVNINFTIVRQADVTYLTQLGFTRNRLPMLWELLQPFLAQQNPNTTVLAGAKIAVVGDVVPSQMKYILDVLDYHANAGAKCLLDLHNYCRYTSFVVQGDGSVIGYQVPSNSLLAPYTTDGSQVVGRIMSLNPGAAPGVTITQNDFNVFWSRFISYVEAGTGRTVKQHPGLAGYGLMNEPNNMPAVNGTAPFGSPEDPAIWTTFAQGAINTIRAIDATTNIYVAGNDYEIGWTGNPGGSYGALNPAFPLSGNNLIYEGHFYLDHISSGGLFDWTVEFAAGFSAGESNTVGARTTTGGVRANYMVTYAGTGKKVAVTEFGMPVGDPNWQTSMQTALNNLYAANIEFYAWVGGNHFSYHDYSLCAIPNFKRPGLAFDPLVFGPMHLAANRTGKYKIYADADKNFGAAGTVCTVTVYARGYVEAGKVINLAKTGAGTLSAASVTLPAGANTSVTFTYTTAGTEDATVTFSNQAQVPPVMHFYSMDPVTYQSTDAVIAGRACLAKYNGREWLASNAYQDYLADPALITGVGGTPRAIFNSGFGENYYNADGMKLWINAAYDPASFALPTISLDGNGKVFVDFAGNNVWGFWSKKVYPNSEGANTENNPVNITPYKNTDNFVQIVSVAIPTQGTSGAVFTTNKEKGTERASIEISSGHASMVIGDSGGTLNTATDTALLSVNTPHIITQTSVPGSQVLRVDANQRATMTVTPGAGNFSSQEIGFIYNNYFPFTGWGGKWYGALCLKGAPTTNELFVLEQYLALLSGTSLATVSGDFPTGVATLTGWYDPSLLTTLLQSSTGGGAVTAAGQLVGQANNRIASPPDAGVVGPYFVSMPAAGPNAGAAPGTTDASGNTTINNLIAATPGAVVTIPGGIIYTCSGAVNAPSGKTLKAADGTSVTLKAAAGYGGYLIDASFTTGSTIQNLTLDGNYANRSAQEGLQAATAINVSGGSGLTIQNNKFLNCPAFGVWMYNSPGIAIKYNQFIECWQPIRFDGNNIAGTGTIDGNTFSNTTAFKSIQGIEAISTKGLTIRNNTMAGAGVLPATTHGGDGTWGNSIYIYNSDGYTIENNTVNPSYWSALVSGANGTNVIIQRNYFSLGTVGTAAMWVEQGGADIVLIDRNRMDGCLSVGDTGGDHLTITSNIIRSPIVGIDVNFAANNVLIQHNSITSTAGTPTNNGIYLWNKSTVAVHCKVLNNFITGFDNGISVNNPGATGTVYGITATGNFITGCNAIITIPGTITIDASCTFQVGTAPTPPALVTPDTERFVIQNSVALWWLDTGATWSPMAASMGGATTGFYFTSAVKMTGGWINTLWSDRSGANTGYDVTYDGGLDKIIFSVGTGAARTSVQSNGTLGGFSGSAFVVTCWDDGTNLNIQINNGAVATSAAHGAVSAGGGAFVGMQDASKTNVNYARFYGMMWAKNTPLSSADRAGNKTWLGAKVGLVL